MKQSMGRAMRMGAKGIKVPAAAVWAARKSHAPSITTRAPFRCRPCVRTSTYGFAEAATTYGRIGVKVWIYKGEVLHGGPRLGRSIEAPKPAFERRDRRGDRRGRRDFNRGERRAPRQEGGNR